MFAYPETDYDEPYRGQFHFSSRSGWLNDPNGSFFYRGTYHLFFQHHPYGLDWGEMHWGHATTPDLVHWTQRPIALTPQRHAGDLWSGNGVVDTGNTSGLRDGDDDPILLFSGVNGVTLHYSTDGARTFRSYRDGQALTRPPGISRDPKVFRHGDGWVMVVWSDRDRARDDHGVDILTSPDLLTWTFRSRFGAAWLFECPDLFPLTVEGDSSGRTHWVLTGASGAYVIGDFDGGRFRTGWRAPVRMDQGVGSPEGTFYAGQTFSHVPDGRTVQIAWQPGNKGSVWTGNMTFPVALTLRAYPRGLRLVRTPVAELASLRTATTTLAGTLLTDGARLAVGRADTYEISATFDVRGATARVFGLRLHTRADGSCDRTIGYDLHNRSMYGHRLAPNDGTVTIRALVDRGQLEIFGNDGELSISDNVDFDSAPASQGIEVYADGGTVRLTALTLHTLGSAWPSGRT
jgi:fructan beta-fructosidase